MDKELIERLAREAGLADFGGLEHFAALIAEECAKVAEETEITHGDWAITDCGHAAEDIRKKFGVKS